MGGRRTEPLAAARAAGLTPLFLGLRRSVTARHLELAEVVIGHDEPAAAMPLVLAAAALYEIGATVPVTDDFMQLAGEVGSALNLTGNPVGAISATSDKALMRAALRNTAAPVRAQRVTTVEEALHCLETVGTPGILKPATGTGSDRVRRIESVDDLRALAAEDALAGTTWIYEEFLAGPEFSVETFTANGVHQVLAITEKFTNESFVEIGHLVPARIGAELAEAIRAAVTEALTALGVVEGPGHTEVIVTDQGPRIVETHLRQAGDGIVELVRLATGVDVQELTFGWLAGHELELRGSGTAPAAAVWFLTPGPGRVAEVTGADAAAGMPGVREVFVRLEAGDEIPELTGSRTRSGFVIAVGDDPTAAVDRARAAADTIEVRYV
jgi:biotin carboxylase